LLYDKVLLTQSNATSILNTLSHSTVIRMIPVAVCSNYCRWYLFV